MTCQYFFVRLKQYCIALFATFALIRIIRITPMKTQLQKLPRGQMELTIELTAEEYQPFLEQAAKKIAAEIKIPGFRPGKASFEIIKQRVGENEIWQEALEFAIRKTLVKVIDENKLMTVGSPQADVVKLAPANPVIYKAIVNLLPQVKLGDYKKIKLTKKPIKIKPEQIKKVLADLQKMRAKETLVNRPAQKNDKVEIDFATFLDRIPMENGKTTKAPLIIGEGNFIPGFEDQLIGMSRDETKEFQLKFPENYHQKNLAGRLVDFQVKMNAVYNLELPELNDDFIKSLGKFQNLGELENQIKENLEAEAKHQEEHRLEDEMMEKIIKLSEFDDIPDLLVDSESKKMIDELEYNVSMQGIKFDEYLTHLKKTRDDLLLDFVQPAIVRVKSALIIRNIGQTENIIALEKEVDEEIEKALANYGSNAEIEKNLKEPAYRDYLKNVIVSRKVIEYLGSEMVK